MINNLRLLDVVERSKLNMSVESDYQYLLELYRLHSSNNLTSQPIHLKFMQAEWSYKSDKFNTLPFNLTLYPDLPSIKAKLHSQAVLLLLRLNEIMLPPLIRLVFQKLVCLEVINIDDFKKNSPVIYLRSFIASL